MTDPGQPFPRSPEQIREDLKRLREEHPADYAIAAARLLKELERAKGGKPRQALT